MFSRQFIAALKSCGAPQYKISQKFHINPSELSHWVRGYSVPRKNNPRIIQLAKFLGISENEIFENISMQKEEK